MNVERKVERLRAMVEAAFREFDFVAKLYETWHPSAYDQNLFDRMGPSYASHAFNLIREALAREIVIGLTKLWDRDDRSIRMDEIGDAIRSPAVIRALAAELAGRRGSKDYEAMMELDLAAKAAAALVIIDRYRTTGSHRRIRDGLHDVRNKRFAHKLVGTDQFPAGPLTKEDVHTFYQDMGALMQSLMELVLAVGHDPKEFASVYRRYATEFWAGARGEKTPGHPNFRTPPPSSPGGGSGVRLRDPEP